MKDIKNSTSEIEAINKRLKMAYKIGNIGAWSVYLKDGDIEDYIVDNLAYNNKEFLQILGINKTKNNILTKESIKSLLNDRDKECIISKTKFLKALSLIKQGKIKKSQLVMKVFMKNTSSYKYIENTFMVTDFDEEGKPTRISGVITDETKDVKYKRMLEQIAYKDEIAGTWNKKKLENDFDNKKIKAQYVSFLDLDNFKGINDAYGHYFGDKCLFAFANRMKFIRKSGMFEEMEIYRVYGDEFVVCFSIKKGEKINDKLDEFFEEMKKEYVIEGISLIMDFSMGLVEYKRNKSDDLMCMLDKADRAMYKVKGKTEGYNIEK